MTRQGHFAQAIGRLRQSIELDPTVAGVHHDLGLSHLHLEQWEEAVVALRRAIALAPDLVSAHLHLATALDFLQRDNEAFAAYTMVLTLDPTNHTTHARLAEILLRDGQFDAAAARFQAAASAATTVGSDRAALYKVHAERAGGRIAEAEALSRSLIAEQPLLGEAYVLLGQCMAETGRSEEAIEWLERGIGLAPSMVAAWQQLATSKRFAPDDQGLIDRMERDLQRPGVTTWQRQAIHFALGKAFDDLGDYATAMRHFDAAHQIRGANRVFDRARLARQTDRVIETAPPGFLDLRPDLASADATPILIVGMPRSGTTLVEQILSSHPDVAAGGELTYWRERNRKGLGVFGVDAATDAARRVGQDYLAVLRAISSSAARITDKMPFNFAHLGVIRQLFPNATIIHCRRHPIDTCLSNLRTNFDAHFDFAARREDLVSFYQQYRRLMTHWRTVLPPARFIEVDYEALVADPEPLIRQMIETCGLAWHDACLSPHQNQRRITTASVWQARQPIYRTSAERWHRYEPWLGALRQLIDDTESAPYCGDP